jgi:solute carrier family 25 protein 39/40
LAVAKEILLTEGASGLFTGLVPRILKVAPACAIMIASYEYCKRLFSQHNDKLQQMQLP